MDADKIYCQPPLSSRLVQGGKGQEAHFADNRPEAVTQRKLMMKMASIPPPRVSQFFPGEDWNSIIDEEEDKTEGQVIADQQNEASMIPPDFNPIPAALANELMLAPLPPMPKSNYPPGKRQSAQSWFVDSEDDDLSVFQSAKPAKQETQGLFEGVAFGVPFKKKRERKNKQQPPKAGREEYQAPIETDFVGSQQGTSHAATMRLGDGSEIIMGRPIQQSLTPLTSITITEHAKKHLSDKSTIDAMAAESLMVGTGYNTAAIKQIIQREVSAQDLDEPFLFCHNLTSNPGAGAECIVVVILKRVCYIVHIGPVGELSSETLSNCGIISEKDARHRITVAQQS